MRRIQQTFETDTEGHLLLRLLLYGVPGSCKTRTAATMATIPWCQPCLMLESRGNPISIRDYPVKPDIVQIDKLADFNAPYNWFIQGQPKDHPFAKAMDLHPPYKSLIIDSITEVQRLSAVLVAGNESVAPGDIPKSVDQRGFGMILGQMTNFAKKFFDLPIHIILTSLERTDKDETTGAISYMPLIWGQSSTEIGGYAYAVGRLVHRSVADKNLLRIVETPTKGEQVESVAFFKPSGKFAAKDQYGRLPDIMVNPTIPKIMELINGEAS